MNKKLNQYVLIDTCVIQDTGSSNHSKSEVVSNLLKELSKNDFRLAISEFTIYENLQGLWGKRAIAAKQILSAYETKEVSEGVLLLASQLQGLYHEEGFDNIQDGDKIIAATTVLENGLVLTRNHKDFPHPFFQTEKSFPLAYKMGHYSVTIDLALYKPDIALIARRIEEKDKLK